MRLLLCLLITSALLLLPIGGAQAATWYVSNGGSGSAGCTSQANACTFQTLWTKIAAGDTAYMLNGTYQGPANMLSPPAGLCGTAGHPITVQALNDGGVLIDGQFTNIPVNLNGNCFMTFQGFNARNGGPHLIELANGFHDLTFRRIVIWDANMTGNYHAVDNNCTGSNTGMLFEDFAIFGTHRKGISPGSCNSSDPVNSWVLRRFWERWEGQTYPSNISMSLSYFTYGATCENCLWTHSGESLPYQYTDTGNPAAGYGTHHTGYEPSLYATYLNNDRGGCVRTQILGSAYYLKATDRAIPNPGLALMIFSDRADPTLGLQVADCLTVQHFIGVVHPSVQTGAGVLQFDNIGGINTGGATGTNNVVRHTTTVAGVNDSFGGGQYSDNQHASDTNVPSSIFSGATNPYTGSQGAQLCHEYINGVLTNIPLWHWPMNQRIKAATTIAAAYSGPCTINCQNADGTPFTFPARKPTDVEADVAALLGPIPPECIH